MPRLAKLRNFKKRDPVGYKLAKLDSLTFLEYFRSRKPHPVYVQFVSILREHMRGENPINSAEVMRRVKVLLKDDKDLFQYFYLLKHAIDMRATGRPVGICS